MLDTISVRGAREHNLKNVSLDIPKHKLVVITGISGSGKSSLAFDTIYAEGQRRYIESLSAYARQFLGSGSKPDVDAIEGLSPAISIDQKSTSHNPRSTVGTVTEIYDYLRLLYARIGLPHCPECGDPVKRVTIDEIVDRILARGTEERTIIVWAPVVRGRKGEYDTLLESFRADGFQQAMVDGEIISLDGELAPLTKQKKHSIDLLVDTISLTHDEIPRLTEAIEEATKRANGAILIDDAGRQEQLNLTYTCPRDGTSIEELEPRSFSFNSPFGACEACDGLGVEQEFDAALVVPDETITIAQGAVLPWSYSPKNWYGFMLRAVSEYFRIDMNVPWRNLTADERELILHGTGTTVRIPATYYSKNQRHVYMLNFRGILPLLERRWRETESDAMREELGKYMATTACHVCKGARLKRTSLLVTIGEKNVSELTSLPIHESIRFFEDLELGEREALIARRVLREIVSRLTFLDEVGLGYLTLSRSATTLAGGEAQRIRLASQVGSRLTGVLYVLDEPSIGLHARDNEKLIHVLKELRDLGNSVLVVEHDEETIRAADYLVDIGPGAGRHGGEIMAAGTPDEVANNPNSITGQFLRGSRSIPLPEKRRKADTFISVIGATENNLQRVTAHVPLGVFTCVTGVSGSGKSTLITDVLYQAAARKLNRALMKPGVHERIDGLEKLKRTILISQAPIGRTPRSNPATYTGVFTPIRQLFAATKDARVRGYEPGRFSFNVPGGRCENCEGDGVLKIEMQFLPDVYIPCDVCEGKRYNRETLSVTFAGRSIADVLQMTVEDAVEFFKDFHLISDKLRLLADVGLGYIQLGQSATTLSGGEAQRIKLASELARRGKGDTLYVLDEPTTGLHQADIARLLEVLDRLVSQGNTVVVIEHNLDVIKSADWLIDLGPEGGNGGGRIIATGTPEEIADHPTSHTGRFLRPLLKATPKAA
ncbi:MAG: excinuclease ABC subunit UvrA [Patescibacteria group bacterium]|jgi:excinuclease ABC subunit A